MQKSTKLIYSAFSGTLYSIPEDDFKLLDMGQLPLTKKPVNNCKKCNGRGHIGRDNTTLQYYVCNCIKKVLDFDEIKKSISKNIELDNLQ